ncbi:MAG: hypothetical protein AB1640_25340 [bacterium]
MSEDAKGSPHKASAQDTDIGSLAEDKDLLVRLAEYIKYLYEEENERRDVLNNTTKIFLGTFGFVVSVGVAKIASIEKLPSMIQGLSNRAPAGEYIALTSILLLFAAAGLLFASFLFTVLVVKMWKRERLCDPQRFVFRAMTMSNEARLLSAIVADYVVAANRNHRINEQKARLLSRALLSFISGFIVFVVTWTLLQTVNIFWR